MKQGIRVIVVNSDEAAAPELRSFLLSVEGVKIVAEVDEPAMLESALNKFPAEVLLLHLDPVPGAMMQIAAPLIEARKDRMAAIAMTENRDAELVVQAMRAGMREFLWKPFNPEQLTEVLQRVGTELRERSPKRGFGAGKLIALVGTVGGVGSTTLATNLAAELAQVDAPAGSSNGNGEPSSNGAGLRGNTPVLSPPRVAIVDLEFHFGQVATYLDVQPAYTIADLCETSEQIETAMIERAMVQHSSGVHVLARPAHFGQCEQITAAHCAGVLAVLQEHYQYIVVDGLRRMDSISRSVFQMTDINMLVLQMLVPSVRNADRILQELRQVGYNMDRVRVTCNRFGREAGYLEPADVETSLGRKVDWFLPDDWKVSSTAVNMGSPLYAHAPKCKLRAAYRQIAAAIAQGDDGESAAAEPGKRGLFSFFSSGS